MRFNIAVTKGAEVRVASENLSRRTIYYGAPPETGMWHISPSKLEQYLYSELKSSSFGSSVEEYVFGFELAELEEWGTFFTSTKDYISYRPKSKQIVSVGQVEWKVVKELPANEQFEFMTNALITSIARIATMKKKPRDFDFVQFQEHIKCAVAQCSLESVLYDPWVPESDRPSA